MSAVTQMLITIILLFQDSVTSGAVAFVTAFGTFANLVVLIGLIYKIGRYTGTTDTTITGMKESIAGVKVNLQEHITSVTKADEQILLIQGKHGESLARLETQAANMERDILLVRDRQHDFANLLGRLTLDDVKLRQIPGGRQD